jgi:hypothetical protein
MNLAHMERCLSQLANSPVLSPDHLEAAQRAAELLRAFRAGAALDWQEEAAGLHHLAHSMTYTREA